MPIDKNRLYDPKFYLFTELKDKCGIYQIRNLVNNKLYIGSSFRLYERMLQHFADLRRNDHENIHLQNAFNKYGEQNFIFEVIEFCDKELQYDIEQYWINNFKNTNNIYNINLIASNPPNLKGSKHPNYGKKLDRNIVEKRTKTVKEKGLFKGSNNPNYGNTGSKNALSVKFIALYNGIIYDGFREYARITGKNRGTIREHCLNRIKKKPRLYMYLEDFYKLKDEDKINLQNKAREYILNKEKSRYE